MIKIKKVFFLFFVITLLTISLSGCSQTGIQFNRESAVEQLKSSLNLNNNSNKPQYSNSHGVFIYKDKSSADDNGSNIQFGPKDVDFNLDIDK